MEDFGKPLSKLFKSFDSTPVAAASLAQVFKAVTHDNKTVAVKAQYIDLRDRYDGDIWTLKVLMKLVAMMHPKFKLSWVFDVSECLSGGVCECVSPGLATGTLHYPSRGAGL